MLGRTWTQGAAMACKDCVAPLKPNRASPVSHTSRVLLPEQHGVLRKTSCMQR